MMNGLQQTAVEEIATPRARLRKAQDVLAWEAQVALMLKLI